LPGQGIAAVWAKNSGAVVAVWESQQGCNAAAAGSEAVEKYQATVEALVLAVLLAGDAALVA
jgi:hypothetical protein